ncbi:MAG: hypothetical protein JO364_15415 [Pseudonocardiales bacterium]|nr:hypothetical protein [Pseudonocardiales bacterium]MBV9031661.1 hypothetical protein [Pseudonocardiales bacterium]
MAADPGQATAQQVSAGVADSRWRPEVTRWGEPEEVAMFRGVGRKP